MQIIRSIHSGLTVVEEYNVSDDGLGGTLNDLICEFLWGDRFPEPVTMIDHTNAGDESAGTPEVLHYIHDALGSVVGLTDAAGDLVERYTYDPYGTTYIEEPTSGTFLAASAYGNPWMWTGQRYDATTRLYHFLFRSYSPRLGRWLQRDPAGYVDGVSLFEYVGSAPLFWVDPLGLTMGEFADGLRYGLISSPFAVVGDIAGLLWDLAWHPIETAKGIYHGIESLISTIWNSGLDPELLRDISSELYSLVTRWNYLTDEEKGFAVVRVVGELGTAILLPGATAKIIAKLKHLKS